MIIIFDDNRNNGTSLKDTHFSVKTWCLGPGKTEIHEKNHHSSENFTENHAIRFTNWEPLLLPLGDHYVFKVCGNFKYLF